MAPDILPAASQPLAASQSETERKSVTMGGKLVLGMSKGRMRVHLDQLGPALFNRGGDQTCGRHCTTLGHRVLIVEKFATYRYVAGWCHEEDPDDPLAVSKHGNRFARKDVRLPVLPRTPLKGVFAKTHLVTMLQMLKAGKLPDIESLINWKRKEAEELKDVLEHGIFMEVFPWSAVRDHRNDIIDLMHSDNFDHGHGLADSEMRCLSRLRANMSLPIPVGKTLWEVVLAELMRCATQKWTEKDIGHFWNLVKSSLPKYLDLLRDIWNFADCESVLKVESAFYGEVAKMPAKLQAHRASFLAAMFMSDCENGEVIEVGGTHIAAAISKQHCKKVKEQSQAASHQNEDTMEKLMHMYYFGLLPESEEDQTTKHHSQLLKGVTQFLVRCARNLGNDKEKALDAQVFKTLETKWRQTLEKSHQGGDTFQLPIRLFSLTDQKKEPETWQSQLDQCDQVAADAQGRPIVNLKRRAIEAGFIVGVNVLVTSNGQDPKPAKVAKYFENNVIVVFQDAGQDQSPAASQAEHEVPLDSLTIAKESKKVAIDIPDGIKWSTSSSDDNAHMLLPLASMSLYQVYVTQSSAHSDIIITHSQGVGFEFFAARPLKPKTLAIIPFNTHVSRKDTDPKPKDAVTLAIAVETLETNGDKHTEQVEFWLKPKPAPKKPAASHLASSAIVPYWVLQSKSTTPVANASELTYVLGEAVVPNGPTLPGKRQQPGKAKLTLKFLYLTNKFEVQKGMQLFVTCRAPPGLELDAVPIKQEIADVV